MISIIDISMGKCKKDVILLLTPRSYGFRALSHRYIVPPKYFSAFYFPFHLWNGFWVHLMTLQFAIFVLFNYDAVNEQIMDMSHDIFLYDMH